MTVNERTEAESLLRKYDIKTLAPLAVSCGLVRVLKEREVAQLKLRDKHQMSFQWLEETKEIT